MAAAVDEFFYACQNMPVFWLGDNGRDSRPPCRLAQPITWPGGACAIGCYELRGTGTPRLRPRRLSTERPSLRLGPLVSVAPLCAIIESWPQSCTDSTAMRAVSRERSWQELWQAVDRRRFSDYSWSGHFLGIRISLLFHILLTKRKNSASARSRLSVFSFDTPMDVFRRSRCEWYWSVTSNETYLISLDRKSNTQWHFADRKIIEMIFFLKWFVSVSVNMDWILIFI